MNRPERRDRRRELEVAAEALEARLVRQPLDDEMEVLLGRAFSRVAEVHPLGRPALLAADVDPHRPILPRHAARLQWRCVTGAWLVGVALALASVPTGAAAPSPVPSSSPFRATSDRTFEDVAYWTSVFDDPKRDEWQKPRELIAELGIAPGATVVDLGAGTGYFIRHLARAVGPNGFVYALETEPNLVAHLRTRAEREGTDNAVPMLASFDNPRLPPGAIDLVLIVDTYHHIDHRRAYFERLTRALGPGGRIAVVDWEKRDLPVGPEPSHKIAREQVIAEMTAAGFALLSQPDVLPYQYVLVFRLGEHRDPAR